MLTRNYILAKKQQEEEIKQKKAEMVQKLKLQLELHSFCRVVSKYPTSANNITRFEVPDDFVSFEVSNGRVTEIRVSCFYQYSIATCSYTRWTGVNENNQTIN